MIKLCVSIPMLEPTLFRPLLPHQFLLFQQIINLPLKSFCFRHRSLVHVVLQLVQLLYFRRSGINQARGPLPYSNSVVVLYFDQVFPKPVTLLHHDYLYLTIFPEKLHDIPPSSNKLRIEIVFSF